MFKNTRLSAVLAAVLFSVTAATALVSAPAMAEDAPASAAASAPAAAPAADAAAAAPEASAPAAKVTKEEVENPYGFEAVWNGGFVSRGTLIILSLMSMGSWYIIITKLIDQMNIFKQSK